MRYIKWSFCGLIFLIVASMLHYTLPQRDIVRVINTEIKREDHGVNSIFWASPDAGSDGTTTQRDVRFIETRRNNDSIMIYRNEDTGWGWPPYFKFDSANLQAELRDEASAAGAEKWVAIRHYGWRNEWFSIYPNALSMRVVDGPDARFFPWFNVIFLTIVAAIIYAIWVRWVRFRKRRIDPVIEDAGEAWDRVDAAGDAAGEKVSGVFSRWFGKKK
jgi:hypothetical protein